MARKFIVEDGEFKLGHVDFHKELAIDKEKVQGGGYWTLDRKDRKLYLYSTSQDFGSLTIQEIREAKANQRADNRLEEYMWLFFDGELPEWVLVSEYEDKFTEV